MPEQDPQKRSRNFEEVALGYSEEQAVSEASRCLQCKKPPCRNGCPVSIDIPAFIKEVKEKNFAQALGIIKRTNSLPAVCGRVCPQESQCEGVCVLAKKFEPVAIGRLERFVADWGRKNDFQAPTENKEDKKNKRVAVVGAGPAGLTAAAELIQKGYDVTVFEALHRPGGVLVYGIPEFRLPNEVVDFEVEGLKKLGVEFKLNQIIGRTFTLDQLKERFDAIFIGTGAGLPAFLGIPGENLNGVYSANEFLTRVNLMRADRFPEFKTPVKVGAHVIVVGGGNVAMDSARTARRLGAEVTVVYRRSRQELPARAEEAHHAEEEGIVFKFLHNPLEIEGQDGWVKRMKVQPMELGEADASGRRRPVEKDCLPEWLEVETVIIAIGTTPNPLIPSTTKGLNITKKGTVVVDQERGETSLPGVFAAGDVTTGAATVISAMGAARLAAKAIDEMLA
ncbi:MAG TPA: glutamate synthase (NADPH), homotetrameric [Cyanobacteria bacterium UBA8530]|nr:glutamate synthase (NADPH), homotetrameric [Cyanobacteria bacterium UBA8530]